MFKKKLITSAITASLMMGIASTSFAATNPFSDVPADSWAYDAVTTLANDGVIDGYPDGTYQGQNTMTRYEMAQIVARAMARTDLEKADKAIVDKLAVEFADELDNLGVRVADLEKKSDNIKWKGELKYKYSQENHDEGKDKRSNKLEFKLEPKAYIGDSDWTANAKIEYTMYPETDSNADGVKVSKAYVEGPLFGATVTAGRTSLDICQGMIFDDEISGMTANFGSNVFNTNIAIGRYSENDHDGEIPDGKTAKDITADYYGVQFDYTPNDNLALNAGYILLSGLDKDVELDLDVDDNKANLWYAGGKYNFDKNVALVGQYLQNADANSYDKAGSVEIQYKGASAKDAGSWGAYIGYRHLGENVTIETAYDDAAEGQKGLVAGVEYAFAENILGELLYFDGKDMDTDKDADTVYTSLKFKF